jgi:hypothetical protein
MPSGYIYILSNLSMPGLVKVGRTDRQPEERARELGTTGVPTPFKLEFSLLVQDSVSSEAQVHQILANRGYRRSQAREFFELPLQEAIDIVQAACSGSVVHGASGPDFSQAPFLYEMLRAVPIPQLDEVIYEPHASQLGERIAEIGRRGCPIALKRAAELFERNYVSSLKFRMYWQEYLELYRLAVRAGEGTRQELGKEVAEYLDRLARNGSIQQSDFDFVQQFLLAGDGYIYEGYVDAVKRIEFPRSIKDQALNL